MPSPTELHFEGTGSSSRTHRWLLAIAVVVVLLLAMFAKATLPSQRSEFLGRWKNLTRRGSSYEFRPDGTYTAVIVDLDMSGGPKPPLAKYEGRWTAVHNALYLTYTNIALVEKVKDPRRFQSAAKERIGHREKLDVEWPSAEQWSVKYQVDQTYQRVETGDKS